MEDWGTGGPGYREWVDRRAGKSFEMDTACLGLFPIALIDGHIHLREQRAAVIVAILGRAIPCSDITLLRLSLVRGHTKHQAPDNHLY